MLTKFSLKEACGKHGLVAGRRLESRAVIKVQLNYGLPPGGSSEGRAGTSKKTLRPGGWISSRHAVLCFRFQSRTPYQSQACRCAPLTSLLLVGKDITVTGIEDGHGGAAEELTTSGTKLNLSCKGVSMSTGTLQSLQRDFFSGQTSRILIKGSLWSQLRAERS